MKAPTLDFTSHCRRAWSSPFFRRLGSLYWQRWPRGPWKPNRNEIVIGGNWQVETPSKMGGFLRNAVAQFEKFRQIGFGIKCPKPSRTNDHRIVFGLGVRPPHPEGFALAISRKQIEITSRTENGLANGLFHLERMMELRGAPIVHVGKQRFVPRFDLRLHCDVWGGYTVTPRWLDVPHRRETFLLMARHGINATQFRAKLGDFFHDRRYPELSNPKSGANLS